jgi:hypothetical protein
VVVPTSCRRSTSVLRVLAGTIGIRLARERRDPE